MDKKFCSSLAFHAMLVLLLGLLAGFPWVNVINGSMDGESRAWRMAHMEGLLNGILMLAVAGAGSYLTLSAGQARWLVRSLMVAGYGNVLASIVGASFGVRGLQPGGSAVNNLVFLLFTAGVVAIFVAVGLVLLGAARSRS